MAAANFCSIEHYITNIECCSETVLFNSLTEEEILTVLAEVVYHPQSQ